MKNWKNFLSNLQSKPYHTRVRILWMTTAAASIILLIVWGYSVKTEITKLDGQEILDLPNLNQQEIGQHFTKIERIETTAAGIKIFFSVKNDKTDILNFSRAEEVKLTANDLTTSATRITDRQNKAFVQKVLSLTENFGIVTFAPTETDFGTIVFENLYFENNPGTIFKETIELDFLELKKDQPLRD